MRLPNRQIKITVNISAYTVNGGCLSMAYSTHRNIIPIILSRFNYNINFWGAHKAWCEKYAPWPYKTYIHIDTRPTTTTGKQVDVKSSIKTRR